MQKNVQNVIEALSEIFEKEAILDDSSIKLNVNKLDLRQMKMLCVISNNSGFPVEVKRSGTGLLIIFTHLYKKIRVMKKQLLTSMVLKILGFNQEESQALDDGNYYQDFVLKKNDSELCITYHFNVKKEFINGNVSFNGQYLKGREIRIKDITTLIEIM